MRRRCPTAPTRTASKRSSGRRWRAASWRCSTAARSFHWTSSTKPARPGWRSSTTARCIARPAAPRGNVSPRPPDVLRTSPTSNALRDAFRLESKRRQRTSDGTISVEGVRFEVPARYPPLPGRVRALRPLGPRPGRSGRSPQRHRPGPSLSAGPHGQRRRPPLLRWAPRGQRGGGPSARGGRPDGQAVAAAAEEDPGRVFRHGTAAGLPAQESPLPRKERSS